MKEYYLNPEDLRIAEENGISKKAAYRRFYEQNWSKERAITTPVRRSRGRKEEEWAKKAELNGISRNTYYKRRSYGWSKEKASTRPVMTTKESISKATRLKPRKYPDWVYENLKKHGIKYRTFLTRVNNYSWSVERACTTPTADNNNEHPWDKDMGLFFLKEESTRSTVTKQPVEGET